MSSLMGSEYKKYLKIIRIESFFETMLCVCNFSCESYTSRQTDEIITESSILCFFSIGILKRRKNKVFIQFSFFYSFFKNWRKMRKKGSTGKFASSWRSGVNCDSKFWLTWRIWARRYSFRSQNRTFKFAQRFAPGFLSLKKCQQVLMKKTKALFSSSTTVGNAKQQKVH